MVIEMAVVGVKKTTMQLAPDGQTIVLHPSTALSCLPNRVRDKIRIESKLQLPELGDSVTEFWFRRLNARFAVGYDRVVYGDHGPYIEFSDEHIVWDTFPRFWRKAWWAYYDEYLTYDESQLLYAQKQSVADRPNPPWGKWSAFNNRPEGYADYRVGKYYTDCDPSEIGVVIPPNRLDPTLQRPWPTKPPPSPTRTPLSSTSAALVPRPGVEKKVAAKEKELEQQSSDGQTPSAPEEDLSRQLDELELAGEESSSSKEPKENSKEGAEMQSEGNAQESPSMSQADQDTWSRPWNMHSTGGSALFAQCDYHGRGTKGGISGGRGAANRSSDGGSPGGKGRRGGGQYARRRRGGAG